MRDNLPRYPVYVPSKGRYAHAFTLEMLARDEVPHFVVVEPQEAEAYGKAFPAATVLPLPWDKHIGSGQLIAVRNFILDHAIAAGHARHWQLDDNIERMCRWRGGKRLTCRAGVALKVCEDFTDRYENIAIAGLNYDCFARGPMAPFILNCHVYSCTLFLNSLPIRWRLHYNEDTDICLQALAQGWCTVLLNAFLADKRQTMKLKGGNTDVMYAGDGRLRMARQLERAWPGVVTVGRRFKRPQHVVKNAWQKFDTPLIRRKDIDFDKLAPNEYGMKLVKVKPVVESKRLRELLEQFG